MPIHKVLIVDDSKTELLFLSELLQKIGMQVRTAENADEAFKRLAEEKPDLILMDVRMPVVDGLSAIRQIRASEDPKTRATAIVSLSGHASAADKEKCLAAGANAYLNKPFGIRDLDRIISEFLRPGPN
jgi:twitching motility two-component system response regulator PilH